MNEAEASYARNDAPLTILIGLLLFVGAQLVHTIIELKKGFSIFSSKIKEEKSCHRK